ncbi:hypothetical protein V1512DRAFT_274430 [Lipomyces arxii]|uniref:uncharacterized protein n=1 Tax=Lipomyces arxii TaxID=56418 RepID=UPI0034CF8A77
MSFSPNPAKQIPGIRREPLWDLIKTTFKPDPHAKLSSKLAIYACLFFILLTLGVVFSYIFVKFAGRVVGGRIRNKNDAVRKKILSRIKCENRAVIIGFFHPYCDAGGGGERVLWAAVHATLREYPNVICAIYTGDKVSKTDIISKVKTIFGIELDEYRTEIVYLTKRRLVDASIYPCFTLLGQALGSVPLIVEAINTLVPDVFIDTMGYAFTFPVVSVFLTIPVAAYVHYPMISTDMFSTLSVLQLPKYIYWRIFALLYACAGLFADVVVVNSTWTYNHITSVWWINKFYSLAVDISKKLDTQIMYPPCATEDLHFSVDTPRKPIVLSIAQFRPEKRHDIIIRQFAKYVKSGKSSVPANLQLVLIGSVRDDSDKKRVYDLRILARELEVEDQVKFVLEAKWDLVKDYLRTASVGVNAMWNEHFGIGVVEYMAAGLIPVVHESGGPRLDIVVPFDNEPTGFHFSTDKNSTSTLANALDRVFRLSSLEQIEYRTRAQKSADRFSEARFEDSWLERLQVLMMLEQYRRVDRLSRSLPS